MAITEFRGDYAFLSNFYTVPVRYNGLVYGSSEAAFQAAKAPDKDKEKFTNISPGEAKRLGRHYKRYDWFNISLQVMHDVVLCKFSQNENIKELLLSTGDEELVEGNTWNDTFWGMCNGVGQNQLGKILMQVRSEIREGKFDPTP